MNDNQLKEVIKKFVNRAINRDSLAWKDLLGDDRKYLDFEVKISFGKGKYNNKPWLALLKDNNTVSNGIFPTVSYFYNHKKLIVGKGVSDQNEAGLEWTITNQDQNWNELNFGDACQKCYYRELFDITSIDDLTEQILNKIVSHLNEIIQDYPNNQPNKKQGFNMKTKNIILYGPPGVGKTYNHKKIISMIESKEHGQKEIFDAIVKNSEDFDAELFETVKSENRFKFVTFHQSYSYEDFIEGFRPQEDGNIELVDGIFKEIAKEASNNSEKNFYLLIDEINRGNISKIFGELITLIEDDKRDEIEITLPYSKKPFKVPSSLYIIATMNSTDKSIALIDVALRRRFTFLKMKPNTGLVHEDARETFKKLNAFITDRLGEDYQIGHSYFMGDDLDIEFILEYKIKPLLEEYFYHDRDGLDECLDILS